MLSFFIVCVLFYISMYKMLETEEQKTTKGIDCVSDVKLFIITLTDMKRLIGRRFKDPSVHKGMNEWPFKVISGPHGKLLIRITYEEQEQHFAVEEISSEVLTSKDRVDDVILVRGSQRIPNGTTDIARLLRWESSASILKRLLPLVL